MGSFAHSWLDNLFIFESKNDVDIDIIYLFRSTDKIVTSSPTNFFLRQYKEYWGEELEDEPDFKVVFYEVSVNVVRDRLMVMGYNLDNAKVAYLTWKSAEINSQREMSERIPSMKNLYEEKIQILSSLTPEKWIQNLRKINDLGMKPNYFGRYEVSHDDPVINYMLKENWYGYPGYDVYSFLRMAIEALENSKKFLYDVTDLVLAGRFDYEDDFVDYGFEITSSEFVSKSKIVVLTEGKTDAWILSETLSLLYPHLVDYYSFLDFESSEFGGGVGNLANVVKAFAGARISNNILALFDNDTAASSACKIFKKIDLPSNIVIQHLPEIDLLRKYPTKGPSGSVYLDVNGMAASIELYLGEDVLRTDDINLAPVQWKGYDQSANQYQGEVLEKRILQDRFRDKLLRAKNGESVDLKDLDTVLQLIFNSFNEKNRNIICRKASGGY